MKSVYDLKDRRQTQIKRHSQYRLKICVCGGTSCSSSDSKNVYEELIKEIKKVGLENEIEVTQTGCHGLCAKGPVITIYPDNITYEKVQVDNVEEIVEEHLIKGEIINKLLYFNFQQEKGTPSIKPLRYSTFYHMQKRVVLRNCGVINPENIEDYIGNDGYMALVKVLTDMRPSEVIQTVIDSELRGRGGAGYLTGLKWRAVAEEKSDIKYILCNADEGDLGAYMDRSILEADPHSIIESMAIAGYAVGAAQGYIYIRSEYALAVENINHAILQAKENNLLGDNVLGTGFAFDVKVRLGAGAYICGEETAMMNYFEYNRGEPRIKILYPSSEGLYQKPTVINNVETFANISQIISYGADWFASMGTHKNNGTKIFTLGGSLNNKGLVEVPMGTTLRTLIEDIGGGVTNGKKFKAAQTGGASGGCIPVECLDMEMNYDKLESIGNLMGAGGLVVLDEETCIVDNTKYQLEFSVKESCGKCTACRIGTKRMYEILDKITKGKAKLVDLTKLEELAHYVKENALCGLGQAAPNPILSTLQYFREEYMEHIIEKKCSAGVCKNLVNYIVKQNKCEGCGVCAASCPNKCISERLDETKVIDNSVCASCGTCYQLCPVDAIYKE